MRWVLICVLALDLIWAAPTAAGFGCDPSGQRQHHVQPIALTGLESAVAAASKTSGAVHHARFLGAAAGGVTPWAGSGPSAMARVAERLDPDRACSCSSAPRAPPFEGLL